MGACRGRVPCDPVLPPALGAPSSMPERQMCAGPDWEPTDAKSCSAHRRRSSPSFAPRWWPSWSRGKRSGQGWSVCSYHVISEWESQPRHRDPVFARDGWRCTVPACSGRRNLHDHHVLFRSRGGGNARDNRVTVCAWHHLRGIHAGVVERGAPRRDGLTWELGVRAGGRPLLRLASGDVYLAT